MVLGASKASSTGHAAQKTRARYNVCPTDPIPTIIERDGKRECASMRWAWCPIGGQSQLKELRLATFNARIETVSEKPFFREPFKRRWCLIPASGYYEWQDTPSGKQPWYFTARDGSPALTIAGLRDRWRDKSLLKPAPEDTLQRWPVSKRVNSSKATDDDPTLIDRIAA